MSNLNAYTDRIRNDELVQQIEYVLTYMTARGITIEDLSAYKSAKACTTSDYANHRTKAAAKAQHVRPKNLVPTVRDRQVKNVFE